MATTVTNRLVIAGMAVVMSILAGCVGPSGTKADGTAGPVTLRLAAVEDEQVPYGEGLKIFARQVAELSAGAVWIQIFPEGTYRTDLPPDPTFAQTGLADINTLTFRAGHWKHEDAQHSSCDGSYPVRAGRISIVLPEAQCGQPAESEIFNAQWTLDHDQLRFVDAKSTADGDAFAQKLWGSTPWQKTD